MADKKDTNDSKTAVDSKDKDNKVDTNDHKLDLGLLEEDDEFEEFPAEGMSREACVHLSHNYVIIGSDDSLEGEVRDRGGGEPLGRQLGRR